MANDMDNGLDFKVGNTGNNENETLPRVLLVENDDFLFGLLKGGLRENNFDVARAENAEDAKKSLEEKSFSVVCFDAVVFGTEGLKALSQIITDDRFKKVPVLLLVDKEIEPEILKSAEEKAFSYAVKSDCSPEEIISKIKVLAIGG